MARIAIVSLFTGVFSASAVPVVSHCCQDDVCAELHLGVVLRLSVVWPPRRSCLRCVEQAYARVTFGVYIGVAQPHEADCPQREAAGKRALRGCDIAGTCRALCLARARAGMRAWAGKRARGLASVLGRRSGRSGQGWAVGVARAPLSLRPRSLS